MPSATAQTPSADLIMFTKPAPFKRLVTDPWADGVWALTDSGAFLWARDSAGLRHVSAGDGLPTHSVNDAAPQPDDVWFAHYRGMSIMSRATGEFTHVKAADGSVFSLLLRSVRIGGQYAWSAAEDKGLFRTDLATKVTVSIPNPVNGSAWEDPVYDVWVDGDDAYISVIGYGLVHWDLSTGEATLHKHNLLSQVPMYFRLHVTPKYVFVGTNGDGLVRYDRETDAMIEFVGPQNTNSPAIAGITQLGSEIWMGTVSGATRYDMRTESWKNWQNLPGHAAADLAVHAGQVYAGTKEGELVVYDRAQDTWKMAGWWQPEDRPAHNVIRGCDADQDRLAFSTGGGGTNFFDPATNTWSIAGREPGDTGHPRDILVYGVASDQHDRWYAHAKGLTHHNLTTGDWTNHRTDGRHPTLTQPLWTFDVAMTPTDVWAATQSNSPDNKNGGTWQPGNLARMNRATNTWTYYGPADGLADENVSVVEPDGNRIWVGTFRGVDVFDLSDNSIRHVFPAEGIAPVYALHSQGDTLWVGTAGRLFSISKTTLVTNEVTEFRGSFIRALESNGADVWVGTDEGMTVYRPSSGLVQDVARGSASYKVYCAIEKAGILYVGTPFGVERLLLATLQWLPQVELVGTGAPSGSPVQSSIKINVPTANKVVEPGASLSVAGLSEAPPGATIEVRFGKGAWTRATGTSTWSATVTIGNPPPGTAYVTARLRYEQQTLAQTSVPVDVQWPDGQGTTTVGGVSVFFDPVQEAVEGEDVIFELGVAPDSDDLSGLVKLVNEDGSMMELQLQRTDAGRLEATFPGIPRGAWSYSITVSAGESEITLPQPGGEFGDSYVLAARAAGASVSIGGALKTVPIAAGQPTTIQVPVTNSLPRKAELHLVAGGEAGSWVGPLATVHLIPNQVAQLVNVTITPPKGKTSGTFELVLRGTVEGFPASEPKVTLVLSIGTTTDVGEAKGVAAAGSPAPKGSSAGPDLVAIAMCLAGAALMTVRRRR